MTSPHDIVAHSPAMLHAVHLCHVYARALTPVLLVGETGTGKSLLARLVHTLSGRKGRAVFVAARELNGPLGADSLFGHLRGAFTDAKDRRAGLLATATDGTTVFEDFDRIRTATQERLLRVLQDHVYRPTGSDLEVPFESRFLMCFNREPDTLVSSGRWLPDLRSRCGWCLIRVPPLRERREDIAPLAKHFLALCPHAAGVTGPFRFGPGVVPGLESLPWDLANARELEQVILAGYQNARGSAWIGWDHLPGEYQAVLRFARGGDPGQKRRTILWALGRTGGCVGRAAGLIGAHRNTVAAYASEFRTLVQAET